ncbi:MAG: hypothetical protein AAFV53_22145 [Myxococcota bacterium]
MSQALLSENSEHILRCRAFVLRTQGRWSPEARSRLDAQLAQKGLDGPTDAVLAALVREREQDSISLCRGKSCSRTPLTVTGDGLPIRETACLGGCRHAPCAHRILDGVGHTHARLDTALIQALAAGEQSPMLKRRRWKAGAAFPDPGLDGLHPLVGRWQGPGGFRSPSGCTRTVVASLALGGRFIELRLENAWPTVAGGADRFFERVLLQPDSAGFTGVRFTYQGTVASVQGALNGDVLLMTSLEKPDRRIQLSWAGDRLSEAHQRWKDDAWQTGFCATLSRVND